MTNAGEILSDDTPLVTVVIPTFNRCELVVEAVKSVIAQTYQKWELVVVDDGSTDGTADRLEGLSEPRLRVMVSDHSGNMSRVRNIGAAAGAGKYLAFLDSDDLWLPKRLESQVRALAGSEDKWSYSDVALIDCDGMPLPLRSGRFKACSGRIIHDLLRERTGAHLITLLVPRKLFVKVGGFDDNLLGQADVDLVLRLAEAADAAPVAEVLALVREHGGRTTRSRVGTHEYAAKVFAKALARASNPNTARIARRRWTEHLVIAGGDRLAAGEISEGCLLLARSLANGANPLLWLRSVGRGLRRWLKEIR